MHALDTLHRWADGAVVYQIYPRSFQDSNSDGIGDLQGIIQRLDYLKNLGVTALWLSPFYPSPMADFGYDVADYCDVDPIFGTLEDFKRLLNEAHEHDIKVMTDIVPSHTSDEHPWFEASKQSSGNKYSDWYIWRDPSGYTEDGSPLPPNNWLDMFSGESSWEWVAERKQFYLHSFHKKQPDLNWENPSVREAMKNVLRFWLDLGVDGFRVDAVPFMDKDPSFADNPPSPYFNPEQDPPTWRFLRTNSHGGLRHYAYLGELGDVLKEQAYTQSPRFMVTEGYVERHNVLESYMKYYRATDPLVATPFIFEGIKQPLDAPSWREFLQGLHAALDDNNPTSIPAYAFGNHDQSRLVSRYGEEKARLAAVMQLTLPGMTFVYYGDELGMHDVHIPPEKAQDPQAATGDYNRDSARTPMQWSSDTNAGFTNGEPWLPLADTYKDRNAANQTEDPSSFLTLYRALIRLRTTDVAFTRGSLAVHTNTEPHILAYTRSYQEKQYMVVINFSDSDSAFQIDQSGVTVISSVEGSVNSTVKESIHLRPHEAVVIRIT